MYLRLFMDNSSVDYVCSVLWLPSIFRLELLQPESQYQWHFKCTVNWTNCWIRWLTTLNQDRYGSTAVPSKKPQFLLACNSLAKGPSFLEDLDPTLLLRGTDPYSIFTFQPLHNFYFWISKFMEQCVIRYLSSEKVLLLRRRNGTRDVPVSDIRRQLLHICNGMLAEIYLSYTAPVINVAIPSKGWQCPLNSIFVSDHVRGMLEGNDYRFIDIMFPFVEAFLVL